MFIELEAVSIHVMDSKHLDSYSLMEELDKLAEVFDTMVGEKNSMELLVLKDIVELVPIIKFLKERLQEHMIELVAKLDIEQLEHIIMVHIRLVIIEVLECKIITINVGLELYKVKQAIEVAGQLEYIKMEKQVFNNKVHFMELKLFRLLEQHIKAVMQNIKQIILAVVVEYIAIKEGNIRFMVANKSVVDIVVFVMASMIS